MKKEILLLKLYTNGAIDNMKKYVYNTTIYKYSSENISNPEEQKNYKIGRYNINVWRAKKLNYWGNPVYHSAMIGENGAFIGNRSITTGGVRDAIRCCLRANKIYIRYKKEI